VLKQKGSNRKGQGQKKKPAHKWRRRSGETDLRRGGEIEYLEEKLKRANPEPQWTEEEVR